MFTCSLAPSPAPPCLCTRYGRFFLPLRRRFVAHFFGWGGYGGTEHVRRGVRPPWQGVALPHGCSRRGTAQSQVNVRSVRAVRVSTYFGIPALLILYARVFYCERIVVFFSIQQCCKCVPKIRRTRSFCHAQHVFCSANVSYFFCILFEAALQIALYPLPPPFPSPDAQFLWQSHSTPVAVSGSDHTEKQMS